MFKLSSYGSIAEKRFGGFDPRGREFSGHRQLVQVTEHWAIEGGLTMRVLRNLIALVLIALAVVPSDLSASDTRGRDKSLKFSYLIPGYGHFSKGQWRKGVSDLWNVFMAIWAIAEPNATIARWQEDVDYNLTPGSFEYEVKRKNIPLYRELQYWLEAMTLLNYINSVLDARDSEDDASFFGPFIAVHSFSYRTCIYTKDGLPLTYNGNDTGSYLGLTFGYRKVFEYYAKMIFPLAGIRYINFYTDYIVPLHSRNLELYLGLGFLANCYVDDVDWDKVNKVIERGTHFHPRFGIAYASKQHLFKLTLMPYHIYVGTKAYDTAICEKGSVYEEERIFRGKIGEDYAVQFTYRFTLPRRLYLEFFYDFVKEREPELQPYHGARDLYFHNFDLSLNHQF